MSTVIDPSNGLSINFNSEIGDDQALDNVGCRPTRQWIKTEFSKYFKYVLICKTRPNHSDYPAIRHNLTIVCRSIFLITNDEKYVSDKWEEI